MMLKSEDKEWLLMMQEPVSDWLTREIMAITPGTAPSIVHQSLNELPNRNRPDRLLPPCTTYEESGHDKYVE